MNVLFLTLLDFESLEERNIYTDLLREFRKNQHKIYVISPVEKRKNCKTYIVKERDTFIVKLRIGNIQKTNIIEKGVSTITIEPLFISGIRKYFSKVHFDLVLYSTPPITILNVIRYVKKRDRAVTYLMLKDIFPQNAVDIGMMRKTGIMGFIYRYFKKIERQFYEVSDYIGCMSQANVDYILEHNPQIASNIVEICPNSIDVIDKNINVEKKSEIREKYGIPQDKIVFIYGGNLGKPQGINFLIRCIHSQHKNKNVFFLIVGDGTEYELLEQFSEKYPQENFKILKRLPKEDYNTMVRACDVGLIFLDYRFTIPNMPSRLLDYMQAKVPVLACTDPNTDIGKIIVDGGFGWWCNSNDLSAFHECVRKVIEADLKVMGEKGYQYLIDNYSVEINYKTIMKHFLINRDSKG